MTIRTGFIFYFFRWLIIHLYIILPVKSNWANASMNMSFPVCCHSSEIKYFNVAIIESRCHLKQRSNVLLILIGTPEHMYNDDFFTSAFRKISTYYLSLQIWSAKSDSPAIMCHCTFNWLHASGSPFFHAYIPHLLR